MLNLPEVPNLPATTHTYSSMAELQRRQTSAVEPVFTLHLQSTHQSACSPRCGRQSHMPLAIRLPSVVAGCKIDCRSLAQPAYGPAKPALRRTGRLSTLRCCWLEFQNCLSVTGHGRPAAAVQDCPSVAAVVQDCPGAAAPVCLGVLTLCGGL